jgi:tripartite-type tricarboxylate transporter receptor subunit TctC
MDLLMKKLLLLVLLIPSLCFAWTPTKTITAVIGYAPGSTNELVFRQVAEIVKQNNPGINFAIDIRAGAAGVIANNHLATMPADGYTLSVPSTTTTAVANDIWQRDIIKYNWQNMPTPVIFGEAPLVVVAQDSSPVNTIKELKQLLKHPKGNINIATSGGTQSLTYYQLMDISQGDKKYVAEILYGNSSQVALSVAGKQTDFGIALELAVDPVVKSGRVKILTDTELNMSNGYMIMLPEGTPADVVEWYEIEFGRAINSKEFKAWAKDNYITVYPALTTNRSVKAFLKSVKNKIKIPQ